MKFEEILVVATIVTGLIWMLDAVFLRKKRHVLIDHKLDKDPWWVEYSRSFFPVLLLVLIFRSFLAEPFRIPSGSMKPTLLEGDFIVVNKFSYGLRLPVLGTKLVSLGEPKRGDVIVFRHTDHKDLIKRVVGLPGDHILFKDNVLYINGKPLPTETQAPDYDIDVSGLSMAVIRKQEVIDSIQHQIFINPQVEREYPFNNINVPDSSYFVMGDNRHNSQDSRAWGFVEDKKIIGRAFATWMSWDSIHNDIRWKRVFKKIE